LGSEIDCILNDCPGFLVENEVDFLRVFFVSSSNPIRMTKMMTTTNLSKTMNFSIFVGGAGSHNHFEKMFVGESMDCVFRSSLTVIEGFGSVHGYALQRGEILSRLSSLKIARKSGYNCGFFSVAYFSYFQKFHELVKSRMSSCSGARA